jgi:tetratricopeptide (TPR) repeat protein
MPAADAINTLEDLRFAWRGDSFEFDVLRRLGDLYIATGKYEKGLTTLKRAVTFFPDDPRAKDAAEAMSAAFAKLYVDGAADSLPPIKALGIYEEFRELTPPNEQGDIVIRRLAERMVAVDLLEQAGSLLEPLVTSRLTGKDKVEAGTRLAVIRLLDKQPDDALRALTESAGPDLPADVAAERKRIEARALAQKDKPKEALAALNGDTGRDADLLRADILWRTHDWAEAGKVLAKLTEQPGDVAAVSDENAQLLVQRAAALWLAGDGDALDSLRDRYAAAMQKTPFANDFQVIAAAPVGEVDSVEAVTARLSQVDAYAAFAADLKRSGPPEAKPDAAKPGPAAAAAGAPPAKELAAK